MEEFCILTINISTHCEKSFIAALNDAQIPHGRMKTFASSRKTQIVEVISAPSNLMPWCSLATAMKNWLKHQQSREVIISTANGAVSPGKDYPTQKIQGLLGQAIDIYVRDTESSNENKPQLKSCGSAQKLAS